MRQSYPTIQATGGEQLTSGHVYVAPPDHHLVVRDRRALVVRGPHENGLRPSIDVLFRSAARSYGRRTVAVVLSGTRDDGVAGASAVQPPVAVNSMVAQNWPVNSPFTSGVVEPPGPVVAPLLMRSVPNSVAPFAGR